MKEKVIFIHFIDGWTCNKPACPTFVEFEDLIKWMRDNEISKDMIFIEDDLGEEGLRIINKYLTIKN